MSVNSYLENLGSSLILSLLNSAKHIIETIKILSTKLYIRTLAKIAVSLFLALSF